MLNTVLASVAALVWSIAYGWFFMTDLRRWWQARHRRRAQAAMERERARLAYAAWVRNIPPPRSRAPVMPPPPLPATPPAGRNGVIIPFPRAAAPRR